MSTTTNFETIANDVITKNSVKINTTENVKNQKIESRKEANRDLNAKFMSVKNRIKFINEEKKLPSFVKAMNDNNLDLSDFTASNLLNCFTKITVTTDKAEKAFRIKLIKKSDNNLHAKRSELASLVSSDSTKINNIDVNFSVLDVNFELTEMNSEIYFVKNGTEYTFVLMNDFSKMSFLQIIAKLSMFKERKHIFEKRELLKAQKDSEKAEKNAKQADKKAEKKEIDELKKLAKMTTDEKIAYYKQLSEKEHAAA